MCVIMYLRTASGLGYGCCQGLGRDNCKLLALRMCKKREILGGFVRFPLSRSDRNLTKELLLHMNVRSLHSKLVLYLALC